MRATPAHPLILRDVRGIRVSCSDQCASSTVNTCPTFAGPWKESCARNSTTRSFHQAPPASDGAFCLATLLPAQQQEHPMPPQQTNLTSETGRDAAGPGLDLSIALVKDAMGGALAAARPIVAPRDASSEQDAAGPPAASTRSVLSLLKGYWRRFQKWRQRQRLRASLYDLSDRELMDIGVTRDEIDCIAAHRAIDRLRDGTAQLLILSRGVM